MDGPGTGDGVCLLGKVESGEVSNVVDFVVSTEFLPANQFEAVLDVDDSLFAPDMEVFLDQGAFQSILRNRGCVRRVSFAFSCHRTSSLLFGMSQRICSCA